VQQRNADRCNNTTIGQGSVVNEVQFGYNTFAQLTTSYQEHSGAVSTSTSPKVQYGPTRRPHWPEPSNPAGKCEQESYKLGTEWN